MECLNDSLILIGGRS